MDKEPDGFDFGHLRDKLFITNLELFFGVPKNKSLRKIWQTFVEWKNLRNMMQEFKES